MFKFHTKYAYLTICLLMLAVFGSCVSHTPPVTPPPETPPATSRQPSSPYREAIENALSKIESDPAAEDLDESEKERLAIAYRKLTTDPQVKAVFLSKIPSKARAELPEAFEIDRFWYALLSDKYELREGKFYQRPGDYYEIFVHCFYTDRQGTKVFTLIYELLPDGVLSYSKYLNVGRF